MDGIVVGRDAPTVVKALLAGDPGVAVVGGSDFFYMKPEALDDREAEIVIERVRAELNPTSGKSVV